MNLIEISEVFHKEKDAVKHFELARWGEKPECPYCNSVKVTGHDSQLRRKCYECGNSFSVTVNTQLHHTRVPLKTWLFAFGVITDAKKGISALQLQRNINVDYKTAFNMYSKIRGLMAMETNKPDQLDEIVEMDETYIGGKPRKAAPHVHGSMSDYRREQEKPQLDKRIRQLKKQGIKFTRGKGNLAKIDINPKRGRGTDNIPVVGIVQRNGDVVAEVMKHTTGDNLKEMVKKYVDEKNAVLITDEYSGYNKMSKIIEHVKIDHQKFYSYKGINTNSIESFWAIVKRGIMGQYHHVSPRKLPEYIAEWVFKYNNRKDNSIMFDILVTNSMKEK